MCCKIVWEPLYGEVVDDRVEITGQAAEVLQHVSHEVLITK